MLVLKPVQSGKKKQLKKTNAKEMNGYWGLFKRMLCSHHVDIDGAVLRLYLERAN
jgi:hypothetical protein